MGWQHFSSVAFWAFLVVSSIALFPFALLTWAATVLFDPRLVVLHRFGDRRHPWQRRARELLGRLAARSERRLAIDIAHHQ